MESNFTNLKHEYNIDMKNAILELMKAYERETEFEGNAINEKMYDSLANNLVKLFTIPIVSDSDIINNCKTCGGDNTQLGFCARCDT